MLTSRPMHDSSGTSGLGGLIGARRGPRRARPARLDRLPCQARHGSRSHCGKRSGRARQRGTPWRGQAARSCPMLGKAANAACHRVGGRSVSLPRHGLGPGFPPYPASGPRPCHPRWWCFPCRSWDAAAWRVVYGSSRRRICAMCSNSRNGTASKGCGVVHVRICRVEARTHRTFGER